MGMSFTLRVPDLPNTAAGRAAFIEYAYHVLNAQARINAVWVLAQWEQGIFPACCAKCGGVKYVPDPPLSEDIVVESSPMILRSKRAHCGSIAACHTGHKIAEAVEGKLPINRGGDPKNGTRPAISWDEACARFTVKMRPGPDPSKPTLLHAVCDDDGVIIDATEGMPR